MDSYVGFALTAPVFLVVSPDENPYCLSSIHFSMLFLISKMWIVDLSLQQAIKFKVGWNTMLVTKACVLPLLNS
jgi:hypothetical protein